MRYLFLKKSSNLAAELASGDWGLRLRPQRYY